MAQPTAGTKVAALKEREAELEAEAEELHGALLRCGEEAEALRAQIVRVRESMAAARKVEQVVQYEGELGGLLARQKALQERAANLEAVHKRSAAAVQAASQERKAAERQAAYLREAIASASGVIRQRQRWREEAQAELERRQAALAEAERQAQHLQRELIALAGS